MTRFDRKREELEREARRARRLAERARERARRKAEQAEEAAERAQDLAERVRRRTEKGRRHYERDFESSLDDFVDELAEKWMRKAEGWMDKQNQKRFNETSGEESMDINGPEDLVEKARQEAQDAEELAARAEARADAYRRSASAHRYSRQSHDERRARRRSAREKRESESLRRARRRRHASLRSRLFSGRNLYKDTRNKKICGVCAGIADYLAIETWKVRLVAVLGAIFMGQIFIPGYFIAYFLMDAKPYYKEVTDRYDDLDDQLEVAGRGMKRKRANGSGSSPHASALLKEARYRFADIEERLRSMESHVTSSHFEFHREFRKISGEV